MNTIARDLPQFFAITCHLPEFITTSSINDIIHCLPASLAIARN
jgi:hypothetical protein